jgi:hypothetical protein
LQGVQERRSAEGAAAHSGQERRIIEKKREAVFLVQERGGFCLKVIEKTVGFGCGLHAKNEPAAFLIYSLFLFICFYPVQGSQVSCCAGRTAG